MLENIQTRRISSQLMQHRLVKILPLKKVDSYLNQYHLIKGESTYKIYYTSANFPAAYFSIPVISVQPSSLS